MLNEVRWIQRYQNYSKAINQLRAFIEKGELNPFEIQGLIQCFEYTFELAWKTMKDYLELQGFDVKSPRETIQIALNTNLIEDGHTWIDALNKQNLMSHTYNEDVALEAERLITSTYYQILIDLHKKMETLK